MDATDPRCRRPLTDVTQRRIHNPSELRVFNAAQSSGSTGGNSQMSIAAKVPSRQRPRRKSHRPTTNREHNRLMQIQIASLSRLGGKTAHSQL